jgi:hypothetical protein
MPSVNDLPTSQLRHLLLTRLHANVGVEAWGADRNRLLEIATDNGLHELSPRDLEEIGPIQPATARTERDPEREMRKRLARSQAAARRVEQRNAHLKLVAQVVLACVLAMMHGGRLQRAKEWALRLEPGTHWCDVFEH